MEEFEAKVKQTIYVSASPGPYELELEEAARLRNEIKALKEDELDVRG